MRLKLLSPEQIEQANQMRLKGFLGADIADRFNVSPSTISKFCVPAASRLRAKDRNCKNCSKPLEFASSKRVYCDAPKCAEAKGMQRFRKVENKDLFHTFEVKINEVLQDGIHRRITSLDKLIDRLARIRMETPFEGSRADRLLYFATILARQLEESGLPFNLRETLRVKVRVELNRREKVAAAAAEGKEAV